MHPQVVEFIPDSLEDGILYISIKYATAVHKCACGCQNLTVTPLNVNGWSLSLSNGNASLTPSIGNYSFKCKSHYFITDNEVKFI